MKHVYKTMNHYAEMYIFFARAVSRHDAAIMTMGYQLGHKWRDIKANGDAQGRRPTAAKNRRPRRAIGWHCCRPAIVSVIVTISFIYL